MKTKFLKLSSLFLILFALYACCEECEKSLVMAETKIEEYEKKELAAQESLACENTPMRQSANPEDLSLKFNCRDTNNFQHLHIDLVNRFSLLGKVKMNSNTMVSMEVMKKEIGTCNKLKVDKFEFSHKEPKTDANGNKYHIFHFKAFILENTNNTNPDKTLAAEVGKTVAINDIIDIHINPNAKEDDPTTHSFTFFQQHWTNYGQQFCKSKIFMNP